MFGWTPAEITALFIASVAPFGALLTYIQWYITRADKKEATKAEEEKAEKDREAKRQDDLREEMRAEFDKKVAGLETIIKSQSAMMALYVRHVRNLEIIIARNGHEVPAFEIPSHLEQFWHG